MTATWGWQRAQATKRFAEAAFAHWSRRAPAVVSRYSTFHLPPISTSQSLIAVVSWGSTFLLSPVPPSTSQSLIAVPPHTTAGKSSSKISQVCSSSTPVLRNTPKVLKNNLGVDSGDIYVILASPRILAPLDIISRFWEANVLGHLLSDFSSLKLS